eukprot:6704495-Alexandrium_andersonii.AAC.1
MGLIRAAEVKLARSFQPLPPPAPQGQSVVGEGPLPPPEADDRAVGGSFVVSDAVSGASVAALPQAPTTSNSQEH